MRQMRRGVRALTVRKRLEGEGMIRRWQEGGTAIRGRLQPYGAIPSGGTVQAMAAVYGARIERMMMLYCMKPCTLSPTDGLCVDVLPTESCDYEVVSVMEWPDHLHAALEWIEEGKRG